MTTKKTKGKIKDIVFSKFYTKTKVVKNIIKEININKYDFIVEPSAGSGAFTNFLPTKNSISLDIAPESTNIIKKDFLKYTINKKYKNILILGNPPFGENNALSKSFLEHSFKQKNVNTVAFILPNIYKKHSRQSFIPIEFKITKIINLPVNSFTLSGKEHHVPCSFFVFEKNSKRKDLRQIKKMKTRDFSFSNKNNFDYFIFGAAPKKIIENPNKNNRGYYIKSNIPKNKLINKFNKIKWIGHSGVNGGIYWLTMTDIIENYERWNNDCNKV